MELFLKIINDFKPLTIFVKRSILDVCQNSEYTSGIIQMIVAEPINRIVLGYFFTLEKNFSIQSKTFFNLLPSMFSIAVENNVGACSNI